MVGMNEYSHDNSYKLRHIHFKKGWGAAKREHIYSTLGKVLSLDGWRFDVLGLENHFSSRIL